MIEALDTEISQIRGELVGFARRQPGCQALQAEYGIGAVTAVMIWCKNRLATPEQLTDSLTRVS